jgi:hypothetical protein
MMSDLVDNLTVTDHYVAVAKVRERLSVSTQTAQKFDMERINLRS